MIKLNKILFLLATFSILTACGQASKKVNPIATQPKIVLLSPTEFQQKLNTEKGTLLDVRTPSEFNKGHLKGAQLLDIFNDDFEPRLDKLDKNTTYFVYCGVGGRSSEACEMMNKKGFKLVYDLDGGIQKWKSQNLPVEQ
jgi:rhodanese-related sulfurtransferase